MRRIASAVILCGVATAKLQSALAPSSEEAVETLAHDDWDFTDVPADELVGCCYWEYARESEFIRSTLGRYREEWYVPGDAATKGFPASWKAMDQIQSIGYAAEVFIAGCVFRPGQTSQSKDPNKPNYRHPQAPPISGSFPAPWQSLNGAERKYRGRIRNEIGQFHIVPVKLSHWGWANEIARHSQCVADDQHNKRMAWEREFFRRDTKGNLFTLPGAPDAPEFAEIRPGLRWGFLESLLVDIAWGQFTNDEIATYFRRWLKRGRPKELKAPSNRGRKPGDWRAHLTRLAVMRLLSRFKTSDILNPRRTVSHPIFDSPQFARLKWHDATKWHDARREAGQLFRRLFPFLPAEEKPRSWDRRLPGK